MKTLKIFSILLTISFLSCNTNSSEVSNKSDYDTYLNSSINENVNIELKDLAFWETKYSKSPNQFPYVSKMASVNANLFEITGDVNYLIDAEKLLLDVNETTDYKNVSYLRSLASNYSKQHKFKQALNVLTKAENIGEQREITNKMLFDVHLELGNNLLAEFYLKTFKNEADFDYLIRYAKWLDHSGNLDEAISALEKAQAIAEASNLKHLKSWTYTNLADFYGHAGEIKKSYNSYLKALSLDAQNAYAKKGIAWIVYSYEKNPDEALRILQSVVQQDKTPDYHLLIADIADFKGDATLKNKHIDLFLQSVSNPKYGAMYNKFTALLYADELNNPLKAKEIALFEVENRPTTQSYDLLAWSYYKNNEIEKALQIVEDYVVGHTYEPDVLFHIAQIYKANGVENNLQELKEELLDAEFELGPIMAQKIFRI